VDHAVAEARNRLRLLVVTFHFPPDGSVGGLRWSGLSRALPELGWDIEIVTAARVEGQPHAGVRVHPCPAARTLNDRYVHWVTRRRLGSALTAGAPPRPGGAQTAPPGGMVRSAARWVRENAAEALAFPDWGRGWILRAAALTRSLQRRHPFDAVVSSGPPHSGHIVALLAGAGGSSVWRVDMRDPWVHAGAAAVGALSSWLERSVYVRADGVITNTEAFRARLRAQDPQLDVEYVPNGIDLSRLPAGTVHRFPELTLVHAGSLYGRRDLNPVIEALGRFLAARPEARGRIRLKLIGNMDEPHHARVKELIARSALDGVVELLGTLPGAQALELVRRSHLALVLAQDQPVQVPAKLYECVAMGIPTLAITESTSATAGEAQRIGARVAEPDDVDAVQRIIEELWHDPTPTQSVPLSEISYEGVARRMDALLRRDVARKIGAARGAAREP
jgi:glycosyltransferase involved in cell wall biosynthesis